MSSDKRILMFVGGNAYPPSISGASSILLNLLQGLEPTKIDVLTGEATTRNMSFLPFAATRIGPPRLSHLRLLWRLQVLEDAIRYFYYGLKITVAEEYSRLFLVFPSTGSLLGGYFVSHLRDLEYQVYLIDLLSDSRLNKLEWLLLKLFEKRILKKAETIYCLTKGIVEFYQPIVNREFVLLPHCISLERRGYADGTVGLS